MCLISVKSYRAQFFTLLECLYESYRDQQISSFGSDKVTFEQCVNKIVFGIPIPPKKKFDYLHHYLPSMNKWKQKGVVELQLFKANPDIKVYFQ